MNSRLFKCLAMVAALSVVAGCKLAVIVGEGGKVQSTSGTRNCSEGSTCEIQVSSTNFSETFTAVPLPGYKFKRWQSGTDYLCGNSTNPICALSNTGFAGNAAVEAIIASDRVYTIKPVFEAIRAARYVMKDGNGAVLGEVINFTESSAVVRQVYIDEYSKEHGLLLRFTADRVTPPSPSFLFWNNPTCSGNVAYVFGGQAASKFLEPTVSSVYRVNSVDKMASGPPILVKYSPVGEEQWLSDIYEIGYGGQCDPLNYDEAQLLSPVIIIDYDFGSRYIPPFTLHSE